MVSFYTERIKLISYSDLHFWCVPTGVNYLRLLCFQVDSSAAASRERTEQPAVAFIIASRDGNGRWGEFQALSFEVKASTERSFIEALEEGKIAAGGNNKGSGTWKNIEHRGFPSSGGEVQRNMKDFSKRVGETMLWSNPTNFCECLEGSCQVFEPGICQLMFLSIMPH